MFGRAIWDKLLECIFENFGIAQVKQRQFHKISKNQKTDLSQKSRETNMWLLVNCTKSTNTFIETNNF